MSKFWKNHQINSLWSPKQGDLFCKSLAFSRGSPRVLCKPTKTCFKIVFLKRSNSNSRAKVIHFFPSNLSSMMAGTSVQHKPSISRISLLNWPDLHQSLFSTRPNWSFSFKARNHKVLDFPSFLSFRHIHFIVSHHWSFLPFEIHFHLKTS